MKQWKDNGPLAANFGIADIKTEIFVSGTLAVDARRGAVSVDGELVSLTGRELSILVELARRKGRPVGFDELLGLVWGQESGGDRRILRVNISNLRRKLEEDPEHPVYILTRPGEGYMLADI